MLDGQSLLRNTFYFLSSFGNVGSLAICLEMLGSLLHGSALGCHGWVPPVDRQASCLALQLRVNGAHVDTAV